MKIQVNGVVEKHIFVKAPAPTKRALMEETSATITPEEVHTVVNIVFTVAEAIKILIAAFKSWFKKK